MVISYEKWIEKVFKSHTHKSHLPPKGTGSRTFSGTNILQPCNKLLSCLCNTLVRRPAFTTSVLVSNVKLTLIVGHYHALKRRARQKKRKRKKKRKILMDNPIASGLCYFGLISVDYPSELSVVITFLLYQHYHFSTN